MKTLNFSKGFVKSGKKVTDESAPFLTLTSLYNGFKLNDKAMKLLGVQPGERVVMFDMLDPNEPCTQEERYYIAAGFTNAAGEEEGAVVSKTRQFNYSHLYGTIAAGQDGLQSITAESLMERGLLEDTGSSKVGTQIITMELVPFQDGEEVEVDEGVSVRVYSLTNFKVKEHTPKVMGQEEVDVDAEDVE